MSQSSQRPNVLILGATGGIGSALARQLVTLGYGLSLAARGSERLDTLATELKAHSGPVDATDSASVEACVAMAFDQLGSLQGVVNCAGSLLLKPAHTTTDEEWAGVLAANLNSSFYVLRSAASRMMRSGGGSIVLLSSAVAQRGMINHEAIAAAKAGVAGLALAAAATYARYNIRVNCVAPGLTRTPLTQALTKTETSLKMSAALHPLGRIGEPDEVANAIRWFLSPENSWVTGQALAVDGGLSSLQARNQPST
jgi:NAD(P)-dependent dehydrogenase (short-subunit alcohol dehydrogenase family)